MKGAWRPTCKRLAAGARHSQQLRPGQHARRTGFGLVEVVVALAVLTIALSALLALQVEAARATRLATERHALIDIAAAALGRWRANAGVAAACRLSAEQEAQGFICTAVERGCVLTAPLRCDPALAPGALTEVIITVGFSGRAPLLLRGLKHNGSGSG